MAFLLDTGIVYALADEDDDWHARARAFLAAARETPLLPVTTIPEVTYLLHHRLGPEAEQRFVRSLAGKELLVEPLAAEDLARAAKLLERHPEIGFVDASIVAIAERLGIRRLATTDRRHFTRVHPRHVPALELLP